MKQSKQWKKQKVDTSEAYIEERYEESRAKAIHDTQRTIEMLSNRGIIEVEDDYYAKYF